MSSAHALPGAVIGGAVLGALRPGSLAEEAELQFPQELFSASNLDSSLDYARRIHALLPWLARLRESPGFSRLPEPERRKIEELHSRERMVLALLDDELERSLDALGGAGIPTLVLKGMDLGRRHYPKRVFRPMTDVDLLVPEARFEAALRALAGAGYAVSGRLSPGRFRVELSRFHCGPVVELHSRLQEGDTPEWIGELWTHALHGAIPGLRPAALGLDPTSQLVYLIRHAAIQHLLESPVWLNDLHFLITSAEFRRQGDWEKAMRWLDSFRANAAGLFTLHFLKTHWETPVPREVLATLRSRLSAPRRTLLLQRANPAECFSFADRGTAWTASSRLLLRESPAQAIRYAWRKLSGG